MKKKRKKEIVFKALLVLIIGAIWCAEFALLSVDKSNALSEVTSVLEPICVNANTVAMGQEESSTEESTYESQNYITEDSDEISQVETLEEESEESEESEDSDELYFLAQVLTCEAGGCDYNEMVLVGIVIMNRVDSTEDVFRYANNIYEVVYQDGQYDYRTIQKIEDGIKPTETSLEAAKAVIEMHDNGEIFYYNGISTANILFQTETEIACAKPLFKTEWQCYSTLPDEN